MSEVLDFYQQQAQKAFSKNPLLSSLQQNAMQDLQKLRLPTRADEDWRYSPLDKFLEQDYAVNTENNPAAAQRVLEVVATGRHSDVPVGVKIPIINGVALGLASLQDMFPKGVIVCTLAQAVELHPQLVADNLQKIASNIHGMHALNSALLNFGLFIYVPKNVHVKDALLLSHYCTEDNSATFLRHLIVAESGSSIKIIEDYQGAGACNYFTNVVTEVALEQQAHVEHIKIQRECSKSFHFGHVFARQHADSNFASHILSTGGRWSRSDTTIDLISANAQCLLNGVFMPIATQHMDHQTQVNHMVSNCRSEQDYRGMASESGQAVFSGKIYVAQDAISTTAHQQNKNLLLSNSAQIVTKPQLEIFADDVVCTHGATVGQLDSEALFYFATRGIGELEAKCYLLNAFAADNLSKIGDKTLYEWMSALLEKRMR